MRLDVFDVLVFLFLLNFVGIAGGRKVIVEVTFIIRLHLDLELVVNLRLFLLHFLLLNGDVGEGLWQRGAGLCPIVSESNSRV